MQSWPHKHIHSLANFSIEDYKSVFELANRFNSLKVLENNKLWITNRNLNFDTKDFIQTTRIGITKAKNIRWRWYLQRSRSVSKRERGDKTPKFKKPSNHLSLNL